MIDLPLLVVDSNVIAKWLLPEHQSDLANNLLHLYQDGVLNLCAPAFAVHEVSHVLTKRVRRKEISAEQARTAFGYLTLNEPYPISTLPIDEAALNLSLAHQCSYYDALFLAVALEQRCDLVTADVRFYNTVRHAFTCVRLLSDFHPAHPAFPVRRRAGR
ncbi:MAG: type II toxin-antitoxin system VapC family toxin [Acidobacteria bacterium]|nr:type II toxin-antitoxin system VapC family toxin [Acidobacteriota bacterium]